MINTQNELLVKDMELRIAEEQKRTAAIESMVSGLHAQQQLSDEQVWVGTVHSCLQGTVSDRYNSIEVADFILVEFKRRFRKEV
jgi:hypothetical protein